ncbi:hypothetical protein GOP47_0001587 [Adiantum capillus-veneris]|uniref:Uncharacterized protein n=1 Tax=Adiantum capillus-veneris TaxID=13818 RepID=A0A9D4V987_ADICA|nr:hypothetical protein GOP47_0001587 [Adiantum capillus-veneris]
MSGANGAALVQCVECGDCHRKDLLGFLNQGHCHIALHGHGHGQPVCEWCTAASTSLPFHQEHLDALKPKLVQGACSTCRIKTSNGTLWANHILQASTQYNNQPAVQPIPGANAQTSLDESSNAFAGLMQGSKSKNNTTTNKRTSNSFLQGLIQGTEEVLMRKLNQQYAAYSNMSNTQPTNYSSGSTYKPNHFSTPKNKQDLHDARMRLMEDQFARAEESMDRMNKL